MKQLFIQLLLYFQIYNRRLEQFYDEELHFNLLNLMNLLWTVFYLIILLLL